MRDLIAPVVWSQDVVELRRDKLLFSIQATRIEPSNLLLYLLAPRFLSNDVLEHYRKQEELPVESFVSATIIQSVLT